MVEIEEGEDVRAIVTPDLRLIFRWLGDRWTHALEVRAGAGWLAFAEAIEADTEGQDAAGMASPTFQEIQWRREEHSAFALLVGCFGPHHYSAVFRVFDPRIKGGRSVVHADIADRCPSRVDPLASTYRVLSPPSTLSGSDSHLAIWSLPEGVSSVILGCSEPEDSPARIELAEAGRARTLARIEAPMNQSGATRRLCYWWSCSISPDPIA